MVYTRNAHALPRAMYVLKEVTVTNDVPKRYTKEIRVTNDIPKA